MRNQDRQTNLASQAARKSLAEEIALVLDDRGTYTENIQPRYPIPEYDPQTGQKNPLYGEHMAEMDKQITRMEEAAEKVRHIYESPDLGKTIYRRPVGKYHPTDKELVKSPSRQISFTPED